MFKDKCRDNTWLSMFNYPSRNVVLCLLMEFAYLILLMLRLHSYKAQRGDYPTSHLVLDTEPLYRLLNPYAAGG